MAFLRNNMNKKSIVLLIFFLFVIQTMCAQNFNNHSLSLEFGGGFLYGTSFEILYRSRISNEYTSELQWNIKPLWFVGLSLEYAPKEPLVQNAIFFRFDTKFGIPGVTGVQENRDWLAPSTVPGSLTHFSSHDNKTTAAFLINSSAGLSMPLIGNFLLKLSLDFLAMYFKFEAWDGYTQYNPTITQPYHPWNQDWPKRSFPGLGVDYFQFWFIPKPAIGIDWHGDRINFKLSFSASMLILCETEDNHYLRKPPLVFKGDLSGGFYYEPKASVAFNFSNRLCLGLSIFYMKISGTRGDLTIDQMYNTGVVSSTYPNRFGAGLQVFSGELLFRINLF